MQTVGRGLIAAALAWVALAGCSDDGSSDRTVDSTQPTEISSTIPDATGSGTESSIAATVGGIDWGQCDDPVAADDRLQCATLPVPLDYDDPSGPTIELALVKLPAGDDVDREGAVLFNPGGPGGSGFEYVAAGGPTIASELGLQHLDLIGFDPRGVDRSGGLRCLTDDELDTYAYPDDTPDTPEEHALLEQADEAFAEACTAKYGDTLQFYSTANTARDMDAIRVAIGDDRISYIGISYGTYLGAVYATMFADHVRAMVLDSAFEPGDDTLEQQYTTQLLGFEHAFDDWASWCESTSTCEFGSEDVAAAWDALRVQLDESPIVNTVDGRIGNQALLDRATKAALYSKREWPVLGAALAGARDGDPSGLFRLADDYFSRNADGTYATIQQSNAIINCASGIEAEVPPDPEALAAMLREIAPRFGAQVVASDVAEGDGCLDLMPAQPLDTIGYDGDAPIVVVGGENDPATPFRWAQEMTESMGPSARLVTYTGEGHGQLLASTCVTEIEARVLVDLELPDEGSVCDPDPDVVEPAWWSTLPLPDGIAPVTQLPEIAAALGISSTDFYSEFHTSELSMTDVLSVFRPELEAVDFRYLGEQSPLKGATQAVYSSPGGDIFSVLVVGSSAFEDPQLQSVAGLVADDSVLVILLYVPND